MAKNTKEKIDQTKETLGVSNLDDTTRKDLFNKFVEGGGEVVSEKEKRKNLLIDRDKQKQHQQRLDAHRKKQQQKAPQRKKSAARVKKAAPARRSASVSEPKGAIARFFDRLKIRFRLKFMRISDINGFYFNLKFLERFNNSYKPALMEIQVVFLDIFKKYPQDGNRIIQRLDKMKPLYYEVIEMIGDAYDRISSDQITDNYVNFPDVPKKVSELKDPLMTLYRKLFLLKPYENVILNSYEKAIELEAKIGERKSYDSSANRKKVKNSLFTIFHKLYPRLHWLFCNYEGNIFEIYDPRIEDTLAIMEAEKPGNRVAFQEMSDDDAPLPDLEMEPENAEAETAEEDEKSEEVSDVVRKGLQLMSGLDFKKLREEYDKKRIFEQVSNKDKILVTYLLFTHFDREYSAVLTTNKIKFNIDFGDRAKTDFKAKFQALYEDMNKCIDSLKEYAETFILLDKAQKEKPAGSNQYIAHTKRIDEVKKKKSTIGRKAQVEIGNFMSRLGDEMELLKEDMDGEQNYVTNPQDVLQFQTALEGNERIHGKKVYEAMILVDQYARALAFRLEPGGDLFGDQQLMGDASRPARSIAAKKSAPAKKPMEDKSVLDELENLDDMDDLL
ncbi:MAG: hypothetical protein GY754_02600 [bacterium]|nr:hypothetical protein [bacterium]